MKILLLLAFLSGPLSAQVTYNYTGAPMSGVLQGGANEWNLTQVGGTVVLAQALNPNQANQVVVPLSYNFGGVALDSSVAANSSFSFTTQNGLITGWSVSMTFHPGGYGVIEVVLQSSGDQYYFSLWPPACDHITIASCTMWTAQNATPGAWVDPVEMVPASELASETALEQLYLNSILNNYSPKLAEARAETAYWQKRCLAAKC
jgi:hypothetical protein